MLQFLPDKKTFKDTRAEELQKYYNIMILHVYDQLLAVQAY